MSAPTIDERLTTCFQSIFADLPADRVPEASPQTVSAWDSLANFALLVAIEEEFGLQVPPDDLSALGSFESIRSYLRDRQVE
ncbi:MAG: acyl carrier protein [Gemmatimonadales bacterium]